MPQHDLFGGWAAEHFQLTIHLPVNKPGGLIAVQLTNEHNVVQLRQAVQWQKPRDLVGLPKVVSGVAAAWQYAPVVDVAVELQRLTKLHLPKLPAHLA